MTLKGKGSNSALIKEKKDVKLFFLACVIAAGVFGGLTAKTSILATQALPAFLALLATLFTDESRRKYLTN